MKTKTETKDSQLLPSERVAGRDLVPVRCRIRNKTMQVIFEATFEDFIDVTHRTIRRTRDYWVNLWNTTFPSGILVWCFVLLVFPLPASSKWTVGFFGFLVVAVMKGILYEKRIDRWIREKCAEQTGGIKGFEVVVEINETGVSFQQLSLITLYKWEEIKKIREVKDRIDFVISDGRIPAVRKRAFLSPAEKEHFIQQAERYIKTTKKNKS